MNWKGPESKYWLFHVLHSRQHVKWKHFNCKFTLYSMISWEQEAKFMWTLTFLERFEMTLDMHLSVGEWFYL